MLWTFDTGLRMKWVFPPSFGHEYTKCLLKYNKNGVEVKGSSNPLKLKQFTAPFIVLFAGSILAFIAFCYEHLRARLIGAN